MRPKTITLAIVCAVAMAGLLGTVERTSSGQQENIRKQPACTIFCGDGTFNSLNLGAKPCWGGPLPADGARDHFKSLAEDDQAAICRNIAAANKSKESCPAFKALAQLCKEKTPGKEEEPKCEPPPNSPQPPWFNPDIPCRERTKGTISWKLVTGTRDRSYTVKMCGEVISYILPRGAGPAFQGGGVYRPIYSNAPGVRVFEVCCDSWRNAANTKSPCDARLDIDCDGMPNKYDRFAEIPLDERGPSDFWVYHGTENRTPNESYVFNSLHAPDQSECKDCKWELVRYESTCKNVPNLNASDRSGMDIFDAKHRVKATWKCPANGQTKENEEFVTVQGARCPLQEPTAPGFRP